MNEQLTQPNSSILDRIVEELQLSPAEKFLLTFTIGLASMGRGMAHGVPDVRAYAQKIVDRRSDTAQQLELF